MSLPRRGVVIVSGGGAISPFTTPTAGCAVGLSAGSTDTGLREALLGAGLAVWTSPANVGRGPVTNDPEANGFDEAPEQLPASLTVNAAGTIDTAGEHLAILNALTRKNAEAAKKALRLNINAARNKVEIALAQALTNSHRRR
mgnify:CR=1 FL=1